MADKYLLRVTAGPGYDTAGHVEVPVNTAEPVTISSDLIDAQLRVRIQNYRGLPRGSPSTSPYFSAEPHASNDDQYSIAFRFTLKQPPPPTTAQGQATPTSTAPDDAEAGGGGGGGVSGRDLQFGNDLDRPIRERLPPGFNTALNIVRWWVDPGLEGDAYADRPHLYGPALSSLNVLHVGGGGEEEVEREGGDGGGMEERRAVGMPGGARERMKWALGKGARDGWVWRFGREYAVDFFNPYLDFNEFAVRLPGFHLRVLRYWDGQGLRYVLRNRSTGQVYLVILFSLHRKEDVNEDGSIKPAALEAAAKAARTEDGTTEDHGDEEPFDEEKVLDFARRKLSGVGLDEGIETSQDDVD